MTKHTVQTEEQWHALRSQFVTASEAAALVGVDPYNSPNKLRNPETFNGNAFTFVGQVLEPVVVDVTNRVLGTHFELFEVNGSKEFYTCGQLGATPDAHQDQEILLECKTTRPKTYIKYGSVPPDKYLVQLMVQMMCTHMDTGYLAIMSTDLTQQSASIAWPISIYYVTKNTELCDILQDEAQRFIDDSKFRVKSAVKQKVKLLLPTVYRRVV